MVLMIVHSFALVKVGVLFEVCKSLLENLSYICNKGVAVATPLFVNRLSVLRLRNRAKHRQHKLNR